MPYAIGCLALADAEVDLHGCCRKWMLGMMNVTICVAAGRGVGRINGWQELTNWYAARLLAVL